MLRGFCRTAQSSLSDPIIDAGDGDSETLSLRAIFSLDKSAFRKYKGEYRAKIPSKNVHLDNVRIKHDKLMVKQMERSIGGSCVIIPTLTYISRLTRDNYDA